MKRYFKSNPKVSAAQAKGFRTYKTKKDADIDDDVTWFNLETMEPECTWHGCRSKFKLIQQVQTLGPVTYDKNVFVCDECSREHIPSKWVRKNKKNKKDAYLTRDNHWEELPEEELKENLQSVKDDLSAQKMRRRGE